MTVLMMIMMTNMMFLMIAIITTSTIQIFVCGGEVDSKILANGEVYDPQVAITIIIITIIIIIVVVIITIIIIIIKMMIRTTVGLQLPT